VFVHEDYCTSAYVFGYDLVEFLSYILLRCKELSAVAPVTRRLPRSFYLKL